MSELKDYNSGKSRPMPVRVTSMKRDDPVNKYVKYGLLAIGAVFIWKKILKR